MPKVFLLCWMVLSFTIQLMAQVKKDTVREDIINYRLPQSLTSSKHGSYKPTAIKPRVDRTSTNPIYAKVNQKNLDTLHEKIDYRVPLSLRKLSLNTDRLFTHYLGLQANHVIEPTGLKAHTDIRNPFSLVYGFNHNRTGLGFSTSWGMQSSYSKNKQQPSTAIETATDKTWFRVGTEIKRKLHQRWRLGIGVDLLFSRQAYLSKAYSDGFIIETRKDTKGIGLGPRTSLHYRITSRLWVGTEMFMYFQKFKIKNKEKFTGLPAEYSNSTSSNKSIFYPISVFAIVRIW
jgi:hypothetical protein